MNYFDEIESYLDGSMRVQDRRAFEAELLRNPELARETHLRREVEDLLGSGPENDLRRNLDLLGERYKQAPSNRGGAWMWAAAAILVATAVLVWMFLQKPASGPLVPLASPGQGPDTAVQKTEAPILPPPIRENKEPEPIAAAYRVNPALESMMGSQLRDGGLKITLVSPPENARLTEKNGFVSLQFNGRVEGADNIEAPFHLKLFSNKKENYEEGRALFSQALNFTRDGERFHFLMAQKLRLKPGLYYYLIENQESGAILLIGKFEVR